jgi:hypothetical protein
METVIVLFILVLAIAAVIWSFRKTLKGDGCYSCSKKCSVRDEIEEIDNG